MKSLHSSSYGRQCGTSPQLAPPSTILQRSKQGHLCYGVCSYTALSLAPLFLKAWVEREAACRKIRMLTSFAGGSSVSRCTHTRAVLWRAGSSILAGAADRTVGSPEALWTHIITVDSCRDTESHIFSPCTLRRQRTKML